MSPAERDASDLSAVAGGINLGKLDAWLAAGPGRQLRIARLQDGSYRVTFRVLLPSGTREQLTYGSTFLRALATGLESLA